MIITCLKVARLRVILEYLLRLLRMLRLIRVYTVADVADVADVALITGIHKHCVYQVFSCFRPKHLETGYIKW